jgi:tetratricopeptide (TPR) repeat protein
MRKGVAVVLGLALAGCAAEPVLAPPQELFRDALFAPPTERINRADVFALNDAMRRFLREELAGPIAVNGARQALIDALTHGQLKLEYDSARTRTAAEAFDARAGNCLSLVILTAAFAKELGVQVHYNRATAEDMWSRDGNIYFLNGHVNVTLGKRDVDPRTLYDAAETMTVDFIPGRELRGLRTREVDEPTIVAMFMNNRAAEALVRGRLDDAYWWARAAMRESPSFMAAYNTLGVVYVRRGEPAMAERAFRRVLAAEQRNTRAWANLALVLAKQGRGAEAAAAERELARLEGDAPFYFFHKGLAAMEAGDYRAARKLFAKEVDRAPDYHEFHFWLALAELRLGNVEPARAELALALENSTTPGDHELYAAKLQRLSLLLKH